MIFVGLVAIIGGIATAILMSPHGFLLAVPAAPFGGSLSAFLGALYLAYRRSAGWNAVSPQRIRQTRRLRGFVGP